MNVATIYIRSVVTSLTIGAITCLYIYMGGTDAMVIVPGFGACVATVYIDKSVSGDVPDIEEGA
jgi:hypothetical protein